MIHTLLAQPAHNLQAAHPMVAEYDQRRVLRFKRWQRLRNAAHRDELTSLDVGLLKFERLANVDQAQLFARIQALLDCARCDLEWLGHTEIVSLYLARFLLNFCSEVAL